jgi:hypothetical protein
MMSERHVVFTPQLWHYRQAEEEAKKLVVMRDAPPAPLRGTPVMGEEFSDPNEGGFDPDGEFDDEGLGGFDGERNHWKSIYLAVLFLDLSAYTLLCRQGCTRDGLMGAYQEWCGKYREPKDTQLSTLLQELHEARNCLVAHPKPPRFKEKDYGYWIVPATKPKGKTLAPFKLDVPRSIDYFRAVKDLAQIVVRHNNGGQIPEAWKSLFRWEP